MKPGFVDFSKSKSFLPQEELLEIKQKKGKLCIGVPKETVFQEKRVPLTPSAVKLLVANGHQIIIERGTGKFANFQDTDYSEAGAEIVEDAKTVFECETVIKIGTPTVEELSYLKPNQTLISSFLPTLQSKEVIEALIKKKITCIGNEFIRDESHFFPVIRSMSEIAGGASIMVASEYLSADSGGKGLLLGGVAGVPSTEVVILGAGTVGEYAARAAMGLGSIVKVFDNSLSKLRRLQENLGVRLFTSTIQPEVLLNSLKMADVVIGAIHSEDCITPCVVSDDMVREMKNGAVIVDISIDQGGCFETSEITTHSNPTFNKYGVVHYCVPNIASRVPRTASVALSNIFVPILLEMGEVGGVEHLLRIDSSVRHGAYLYRGIITNKFVGETYNLPYKDLDMLMAVF